MSKILIFSNIFPYYSKSFWSMLINQRPNVNIGFQSYNNRGIKQVNIKKNFNTEKQKQFFKIKNLLINNKYLVFQIGVISRCLFQPINTGIFLGDTKIISTWISIIICKIRGVKVVLWTHGFYGRENKISFFLRKTFYSLADEFLLYERRGKKLMIKSGFKKDKIHIIFNSLDFDFNNKIYYGLKNKKKNLVFKKIFLNPENDVLIFIGRLTPEKKIHLLINSFQILSKKIKLNLLIIGDGPERNYLENLSKDNIKNKTLHFFGESYSNQLIGEMLYHSSICVSPGNVGLTAIHSLSFGTPIITHDNFNNQGPEHESIVNNYNGMFFKENDVADLTRKIKFILDNKGLFKPDNCRKPIKDFYNPNYMLKVMDRVISNEKPIL